METIETESDDKRYAELQALALDYARSGETELLARMLWHGLPVNLADARGNTLLMLASYNGNAETVRMLLENGADEDRRNDRGQTPLGGVAFRGYEQIVTLLLEHGADIDADNGGGMTPLMYAAMFGRARVAAQTAGSRCVSSLPQPVRRFGKTDGSPFVVGHASVPRPTTRPFNSRKAACVRNTSDGGGRESPIVLFPAAETVWGQSCIRHDCAGR